MPELTRDRGAIGVMFGLLISSGMLLAMLAVVVDIGRIHAEKQELQSGADAAAMALAQRCTDIAACDVRLDGTADLLSDGNAKDGLSKVSQICGNGPGLTACPADATTNITDCAGGLPPAQNFVQVRTQTEVAGNKTVLPPLLAHSVLGAGGTSVGACARAAWGSPRKMDNVLPYMVSRCMWNLATNNGAKLIDPPAAGWAPDNAMEGAVLFKSDQCPSNSAGNWAIAQPGPGAFCLRNMEVGQNAEGVPANVLIDVTNLAGFLCQGLGAVNHLIQTLFPNGGYERKTHYLPIFEQTNVTGLLCDVPLVTPILGNVTCDWTYTIVGFAAFVPTGANLGGLLSLNSQVTGNGCQNPCMTGFFARRSLRGPVGAGAGSFGVNTIELIG